jgi:hypothetical protein
VTSELEPHLKPGATVEDEEGETHAQATERREQQHRHEMELQEELTRREIAKMKAEVKRDRITVWCTVAVVIGAAVVLLGIAHFINAGEIRDKARKIEYTKIDQQRELVCFAKGGGWVSSDLLVGVDDSADHGLCVFPRASVNVN